MNEALARLPETLGAHLRLALLALALGGALSLPLGVWAARRPRLAAWVVGSASVVQTIPSLALLALMVPLLAVLGAASAAHLGIAIQSIGFLPALIALTLYSTLPMIQNTVAGLGGVPAPLLEAARGVGMSPRQSFWQVELPVALPVVLAGVRTAAVWVVGTATLSTPVGASSLGDYIFSGLQTRNYGSVLVGCAAAAALALLLDGTVRLLEAGLTRRSRIRTAFAAGVVLALSGLALAGPLRAGGADAVRIGAKTFTEQYILAAALADWIPAQTGRAARTLPSLGSTVLFDALRSGDLDLYVDYSGTLWATILRREGPPPNRARVVDEVARALDDDHGIHVAAALGFENTYALAIRRDLAERLGVRRLSELARHSPELEIGGDYEFFVRPEWQALVARYGFAFGRQRSMDSSLMYGAAATGDVDVISAFSTDARIDAFDLVVLEDDAGVIPPYDALVLVRGALRDEAPDLVAALEALDGAIDVGRMRALNGAVDRDGRSPESVGRELARALADAP